MTGFEIPLMIAGIGLQAYSTYQQGRSDAQQAKQVAAWHAYNARQAEREAEAERKALEIEAQQHKRRAKQFKARQRAIIGASGLTPEGSPLLVLEDTAAQLALENALIREQGYRRVSAYRSQSILDFSKASAISKSAKGYKRAGLWRAGGSLLGGAAGVSYMSSAGSPWFPALGKKKYGREALATMAKY